MDLKALGEGLGLEEDEFKEIVEIFVETAEADIARLSAATASQDANEAMEAAHSLKGAAGNLGFTDISEVSKILEEDARKGVIDQVEKNIPVLMDKLNEIKSCL
jgi:HPt (histidine-containing phosphotransfer) domain-containing protein